MKCHYSGHAFLGALSYTARMKLRIKELRTERGLTQDQLAEKARISRSQLAMIEGGTRPANTLRLNSIAAALGVHPDELFAREGERDDLFAMFRRLSPEDQEIVARLAESLAAKAAKAD